MLCLCLCLVEPNAVVCHFEVASCPNDNDSKKYEERPVTAACTTCFECALLQCRNHGQPRSESQRKAEMALEAVRWEGC